MFVVIPATANEPKCFSLTGHFSLELQMSLCNFNESGVITFAGVAMNVTANQAKYSLRLSDWPWVNRTSNVMLFRMDTHIYHDGLDDFYFGWLGTLRNGSNRNFMLGYKTKAGLSFEGVLQFWAQLGSVIILSVLMQLDLLTPC